MRIALALCMLTSLSTARAQEAEIESPEALGLDGAEPAAGTRYIVGPCGIRQRRWNGDPLYEGIWDRAGHGFRGLGSPGHRVELDLGFHAAHLTAPGGGPATGYDMPFSFAMVLANLSGRFASGLCLTHGVDVNIVGGWHSIGEGDRATAGHFGARLGLLSRSRDDRMRVHVEAEIVFPSADYRVASDERDQLFQAAVAAALALGVDDEILALGPLEWGVRGIGLVQYQWANPDHPESGLWVDLRVSIGYARLATYYGAREGLVGGVRLSLLGGSGFSNSEWSLRGGVRGALSVGSLWPSDFVVPADASIVLQLAHTTHNERRQPSSGALFEVFMGVVWGRFFAFEDDFGTEAYYRGGIRYTQSFDNPRPEPQPTEP